MSAFALPGLILVSPLLLLCALAVWLEYRGPVFFAQMRVGKNRRPFKAFKFRTMRADTTDSNPYTQPKDARITRTAGCCGRRLR